MRAPLEELDWNQQDQFNPEADKNLAVRFFVHPMRNDEKSAAEGRPIFEDTDFIEVRVRGDRNNITIRPVREGDARRFPTAYRDFKSGAAQVESGTPLSEWPAMSRSMVEELKYLGFSTVENLATANDSVLSKVAGLRTWAQKAQSFIELTKGLPAMDKLHDQMEDLSNKYEVQSRQLKELIDANSRLTAQLEARKSTKKVD